MSVMAILSVSSKRRLAWARAWLDSRGRIEEILLLGATLDAANELARVGARHKGAAFGWHRLSMLQLASAVAAPVLATRGLVPITRAGTEAVVTALLQRLRAEGELSRYEAVAGAPGFPRAIGQVIAELRMAGVQAADLGDAAPGLVPILRAYEHELVRGNFVDWPGVLHHAAEAAKAKPRHRLIGLPTLLLDVSVASAAEFAFINALAAAAPEMVVTMPAADSLTLARFRDKPGVTVEDLDALPNTDQGPQDSGAALARLQRNLFKEREPSPSAEAPGDEIEVFSAPGEGRECVEIVRRVLALARDGTAFDRIAVLLRSPADYRAHLEEAFSRADVPFHFARGAVRPDPAGRAF
jgi:ATP-dependent helicase/DNAse subunit B